MAVTSHYYDGHAVSFANNVPTSDSVLKAWKVNDIRINTDPASNIVLWKCLVAGTPGTWVSLFTSGASGTVTSVSGGAGISITSPTTTPVITNTGILALTQGTGITITGTSANKTITNNGVTSVAAGTGISVSGTTTPTITNTGVLAITAGTNITVSNTSGTWTINSTGGGSSYTAGTGISIVSTTIANTGVLGLSVTPGTGLTLTGTAQNPILTGPGTGGGSYTAGTGISIVSTAINNTGVLTTTASTVISSSGGQNPNITHNTIGPGTGTFAYPGSMTIDNYGHISAITSGSHVGMDFYFSYGMTTVGGGTLPTVAEASAFSSYWMLPQADINNCTNSEVNFVREWQVARGSSAYTKVQLDLYVYSINLTATGGTAQISFIVTKDGADTACSAIRYDSNTGLYGVAPTSITFNQNNMIGLRCAGLNILSGFLRFTAHVSLLP